MSMVRAMGMMVMVALIVSAVGCGGSSDGGSSIVGNWWDSGLNEYVTFRADGTFALDGENLGTYKTSGSTLTVTVDGMSSDSQYKISGDTLTITFDGTVSTLTRVDATP